jgi:hypothetical protein
VAVTTTCEKAVMDEGNADTTLAPPHPLAGIRILVVDGSPVRRLSAHRSLGLVSTFGR